jgi:type II secretory pathway pseudopilin PulG
MNAPVLKPPRHQTAPRARRQSGFTLVELMVSLTGGLFLSIVVFALARDGQRFYQRESRLANATLAGIAGFDRLRADIARAGFLTSPNVNLDPRLCSRPDLAVPWPAQLGTLRSVTVNTSPPVPTALANNGITPHRILLAGSYASSEEFPIRSFSVNPAGGAQQIFLQVNSGAMARLGYLTSTTQQALLASVFGPGRALRMVDREGMQHYAVVGAVTGGTNPSITLAPNPSITLRSGAAKQCGAKGFETGATVNVVNFIQYDVASMSANANYAKLFTLSAAAPGENQRTELVRTELDAAGAPIAGTQELVAEYAVDLRFGLTGITGVVGSNPTVGAIPVGQFTAFAGTAGNAQRLRAVRARLSVRSREPDREANVGIGPTVAAGLYRFMVVPAQPGVPPQFARVRTFQADIALHNHTRLLW